MSFAIEKKLPLFNPGTQGEHKILRGLNLFIASRNINCFRPPFMML
nr:peptidogalycan biosysnthesis protein [Alteromonas stellipolaris]